MSSSQALWYLTRGSGVVALLLLTATTLLGVLASSRWRGERWPRFAVADLHRNLTLLALAFIGIHVGTTITDAYAPIGVKDVFIPFVSLYRPIWLGLGALALDLLLAITITSLLRRRIGYRTWRALHWAAYATWPLALAHGLGSGSDARFGWMAAFSFACLALVAVAVAVRLYRSRSAALQLAGGAVAFALALVIVTWYQSGPARHGWAARAGTPSSLLKRTATPATRQLASSTQARMTLPFSGRLVGRMSSSGPDAAGDAAVAIALAVRGSEPGVVRLTLWGSALEGGGLAMSESQVSYEDAATGTAFTGSVVGLDGNRVVADVASASGSRLRLLLVLRIDPQAGTVTGVVRAAKAAQEE
jgi:sulfoxide reductase heme-binding subunit YedZ